jgi:pimeloyl-ACP methyl ester carboxylesterase
MSEKSDFAEGAAASAEGAATSPTELQLRRKCCGLGCVILSWQGNESQSGTRDRSRPPIDIHVVGSVWRQRTDRLPDFRDYSLDNDALLEKQAAEIEKLGFSPSAREVVGEKFTEAEIKTRSAAALANANQDRFSMAALTRAFRDLTFTAQEAANATVPTLGISGSDDPYLADLRELKRVRPTLRLEVIEGATHDGERSALRRPEFVAAVREFLAAHRPTSSR